MVNDAMYKQMSAKPGFVAALDQSGGSTPGALRAYGIPDSAWHGDEAEMFRLMHEMRVRLMTPPSFRRQGDRRHPVRAHHGRRSAGQAGAGLPVAGARRRAVPQGRQGPRDRKGRGRPDEADPRPRRPARARRRARRLRHQDALGDQPRLAAGHRRDRRPAVRGRPPDRGARADAIIEPEISIKSPDKAGCEALLRDALLARLDALPKGTQVMLKLTLPETADFYLPLIKHAGVARVVALSGGYTRAEACRRLAANHDMIASFSRALTEGLTKSMSDAPVRRGAGRLDRRDLPRVHRQGRTGRVPRRVERHGSGSSPPVEGEVG